MSLTLRVIARVFSLAETSVVKNELAAYRSKPSNQTYLQTSPFSSKAEPKYLWTITDLKENAVAKLGSMDEGSYEEFVQRMLNVAKEARILEPTLGLGIKFKKMANFSLGEKPYPIKKGDWGTLKEEAKIMCDRTPEVYLFDGSQFIIPRRD